MIALRDTRPGCIFHGRQRIKHDLLSIKVGAVGAGEQCVVLFPGLDPALRWCQRTEPPQAGGLFRQVPASLDTVFAGA